MGGINVNGPQQGITAAYVVIGVAIVARHGWVQKAAQWLQSPAQVAALQQSTIAGG